MAKNKFEFEFELRASKKMLFPYLNTAGGLAEWFADDVNINEDRSFIFVWDDEDERIAKMVSQKLNKSVKFEFLDDEDDPSYIILELDMNEMTSSVFLRITDYSENDDYEDAEELWEATVNILKEVVGG